MIRRRAPHRSARRWLALGASAALHGAAALGIWAVATAAPAKPPVPRVYKVDIVSPPPSQSGPRMAEPPAESPGAPAAATPQPSPAAPTARAPQPTSPPPAPEPTPAPAPTKQGRPAPAREAAPTPSKAPAKTPAAPTHPEPTPPARATSSPAKKPAPAASARAGAAPKPDARVGAGTTGPGRRVVPATGDRPVASSSAGEGLNVRTNGADFVDRVYLENIIRQVRRRFRPPPGARTDRASVRFWIERDGRVREMEMAGGQGSFAFRTAALEAVERAGTDGAFGPLPRAYPGDRLAITFDFSPPS